MPTLSMTQLMQVLDKKHGGGTAHTRVNTGASDVIMAEVGSATRRSQACSAPSKAGPRSRPASRLTKAVPRGFKPWIRHTAQRIARNEHQRTTLKSVAILTRKYVAYSILREEQGSWYPFDCEFQTPTRLEIYPPVA